MSAGGEPRVAVVGHVEWVDFARVARLPAPGEIGHASELRTAAAGGGTLAAAQLAALAGSCAFLCAVGDDDAGQAALADLRSRPGLDVHAAVRAGAPQRRGITFVDDDRERTIVVARERLVPHGADPLPWDGAATWDAVYVTGGDPEAVRAARAARFLVATPRAREALLAAGVEVDVLVGSAADPGEAVDAALAGLARHVVRTEGACGGSCEPGGRWEAAPLPGEPADAYGCGDVFAAGLTYGLAVGQSLPDALAIGARCGAAALCLDAPAVPSRGHVLDGAPLAAA